MNATHARPMLAYWLLAVVAAVITSAGLRAQGPSVVAPPVPSASVGGSATPKPVPSALLRPTPASALSLILWGSATAAEHAQQMVQVAAPRGKGAEKDSNPTDTSIVAEPGTTATAGGSGKGNHNGGSGTGSTTAARPTTDKPDKADKGHGKGHGNGHGNGDTNPGKGRGH